MCLLSLREAILMKLEVFADVTGKDKAEMVARLRAGDTSIPAGRVHNDRALNDC